ncbi:MAG: hypothetical protein KIT76_06700 [Pseudolabrys sp.]|nr:hypothetical protein [Pseudolabrys sp.]
MKIARVETRPVVVTLKKPIGTAFGQINTFGCVLVFVHGDTGVIGENLVFTLNNRRTKVLRQMIDELADLLIGRDAGHIAEFWARAWKDINFLGHKGVPVVGISAPTVRSGMYKTVNLRRTALGPGGAQARVPAYHSGGLWLTSTINELTAEAESFLSAVGAADLR